MNGEISNRILGTSLGIHVANRLRVRTRTVGQSLRALHDVIAFQPPPNPKIIGWRQCGVTAPASYVYVNQLWKVADFCSIASASNAVRGGTQAVGMPSILY